jgi:hypothetical protein
MKRGIALVALLLVAAGAWLVVSPILAVRGLGDAIERSDAVELEQRVDFPALRQGFKDQINAAMLERSGIDAASNPLGAFAVGLAAKLADGMVDVFVTPAGLALLARGRQPILPPGPPPVLAPREEELGDEPPAGEADAASRRVFADARIDRESFDRFSLFVPDERGGELRFGFRRHGFGWKLEHVALPFGDAERTPKP